MASLQEWSPFQMMLAEPLFSRTFRSRFGSLVRALRDRRGVSAVEFALVAPVLIAIPIPVYDIGSSLHAKMQVEEAVQAGAQYVIAHTFDSAKVSAAAAAASSLPVTITTAEACGCPSGNTISAQPCGNACPNGTTAKKYATINGQATYTPLISYPVYGNTFTLTASSTVIEQ